jgi:hypothetical protein
MNQSEKNNPQYLHRQSTKDKNGKMELSDQSTKKEDSYGETNTYVKPLDKNSNRLVEGEFKATAGLELKADNLTAPLVKDSKVFPKN